MISLQWWSMTGSWCNQTAMMRHDWRSWVQGIVTFGSMTEFDSKCLIFCVLLVSCCLSFLFFSCIVYHSRIMCTMKMNEVLLLAAKHGLYGCQTWSLNKQMTNKLSTAQTAMERKMSNLKLQDNIPCSEIRKDNWYHRILTETKVEMGRSYSKNEGQ